jgi:hypothetical protein
MRHLQQIANIRRAIQMRGMPGLRLMSHVRNNILPLTRPAKNPAFAPNPPINKRNLLPTLTTSPTPPPHKRPTPGPIPPIPLIKKLTLLKHGQLNRLNPPN